MNEYICIVCLLHGGCIAGSCACACFRSLQIRLIIIPMHGYLLHVFCIQLMDVEYHERCMLALFCFWVEVCVSFSFLIFCRSFVCFSLQLQPNSAMNEHV